MRAQISDPARLPEALPEDLRGVCLGVHVAARDDNEIAESFQFQEGDGETFRAFWESCYGNFGADPAARIVIVMKHATFLTDPETGTPFEKVSLVCVQDAQILRFTAEQARWFLECEDMVATDIPSASVL